MISKVIDDNSVSVIPEDSDDLLTLRRIVKKGDRIIGDTTRVIKQEKDFSRPDRGERIKIRISIEVEKPSLDNMLDRLRLRGVIVESTNESVPHGSHHSFVVKINDAITIFKKKWSLIEKKLIRSKNQKFGFLFVAIDSLIFSEKFIQTLDEEKVIEFLNDVEEKGSKVFSVDSTTDLGLRVSGLGGIVSLLRFAINN